MILDGDTVLVVVLGLLAALLLLRTTIDAIVQNRRDRRLWDAQDAEIRRVFEAALRPEPPCDRERHRARFGDDDG